MMLDFGRPDVFPHRAIRINLLISLATLAMSAVVRLGVLQSTNVAAFTTDILAMLLGGIIAAWIGAGLLARIPKERIMAVIAALLLVTAALLAAEAFLHGTAWTAPAPDSVFRVPVAILAGLLVGAISSLLGVAGGRLPARLRLHLRPSIAQAAPSDLVTRKNQTGGRRPAAPKDRSAEI